jgi:hypothetical protein
MKTRQKEDQLFRKEVRKKKRAGQQKTQQTEKSESQFSVETKQRNYL